MAPRLCEMKQLPSAEETMRSAAREANAPDVGNAHSYWHVTGSVAENDAGPSPPLLSHVN